MENLNLIEDKNGVNLCKCNNCDTVLIDENPQTGAKKYKSPLDAENMDYLKDGEEYFWACPKCETDDDLIDL